ncbi:hypothetical protein LSH36_1641g00046 [Paralvinella palmiformis]|uniref:Uncharacterized protein n=1 Tax=Paralvinella palmiformis TaxID=53620 RepID=A0AAD9MQ76_9ANNE|nr:hypothetical protein LSH36_1641g00046 [Paralvinella palmiformis]
MNGTEFKKQVTTPFQAASYCLYVEICKDLTPEYHVDNCDEKKSPSRLLCQYDESKTDICSSSDSHFGDKCYRKTTYDGQEPNRIDWYNGEAYCRQSDIQGDIAYSYLDDDTLINSIINLVGGSIDCVQLWFGVRKRIWFWMTVSANTTVTGHKATSTTSDRNATVKWEENKFPLGEKQFVNVYIAPIMIGLVILTVVPGLVAFFVLRNKRRLTKDEPEYADIEPDESLDDVISPHGIVSTGKIPVGEIKHKEAPSGDLYAMSIKQINKSNGDLDTKKKGRNPEELHTKAKKKRNRKPKPSGGENIQHFEGPSGELYATVIK